jgi:hypothetical protein
VYYNLTFSSSNSILAKKDKLFLGCALEIKAPSREHNAPKRNPGMISGGAEFDRQNVRNRNSPYFGRTV